MTRNRNLSTGGKWLAMGLLGLLPLASGCDEKKDTAVQAPPQSAAEQQREQEARQKAYGASGLPPAKGSPAAKPAEKPAEKPEEKPSTPK
jgi:hypothetical protein